MLIINKGKNIMVQSNINMDLVINISLRGFTENQLIIMLCEAVKNMTPTEAETMLAKIGMTHADLT
jgi:hypothetical protein